MDEQKETSGTASTLTVSYELEDHVVLSFALYSDGVHAAAAALIPRLQPVHLASLISSSLGVHLLEI